MQYRTLTLFIFAFLFLAAIPACAQTVTGILIRSSVMPGSTVRGKIILDIPDGLHVNSSKPKSEYAIPTSVNIIAQGLRPVSVDYPDGTDRKFQFSKDELNVYEGKVEIPFSIAVPRRFRGSKLAIKAVVQYQACTEEVCYAPKSARLMLTAAVRRMQRPTAISSVRPGR